MDSVRIGRSVRDIRIHLGWRQDELAGRAGVSRTFVSKVERGRLLESADVARLERVCRAVGGELDVRVRWRGEALDRLLDEAHARLVEAFVTLLREAGWVVELEVTFNEYGERGSIDVFAWYPVAGALLVAEIKSLIVDAQGTLAPVDRKARLAPKLARARGWVPRSISRLLVVAEGSTNRGRVARLDETFRAAFPVRGPDLKRWLRSPGSGSISGLLFLRNDTTAHRTSARLGRQRVRRRKSGSDVPQ